MENLLIWNADIRRGDMEKLELYAKEKEQEKETLKRAAIDVFKDGKFNADVLETVIDKSYQLGHHAGHCRGEMYKIQLVREVN